MLRKGSILENRWWLVFFVFVTDFADEFLFSSIDDWTEMKIVINWNEEKVKALKKLKWFELRLYIWK